MNDTSPLLNLPEIPEEYRPRKIFVQSVTELDKENLETKGYELIPLLSLPRRNSRENIAYLMAKAQAIEEGTVAASTDQRLAMVTQMQALGLMDKRNTSLNLDVKISEKTVEALLDWNKSRHTLANNSTVQGMPKLKGKK